MKKLGLLVMPIMAVSLLASCGEKDPGPTPTPTVVKYFVSFESKGGTHIDTQRVIKGYKAKEPKETPIKPGYQFEGWYTTDPDPAPSPGEEPYDFNDAVNSDITLYAYWTESEVTYHSFTLNGTGCGIFNDPSYTQTNIKEGSNLKFSIVPDSDHTNPMTVQITEGSSCASYANGIVAITNMNSDVKVTASATEKPGETCLVDFNGADSTAERVISATKIPFTSDNIEKGTEVTLELSPKVEQRFELDATITFLVDGVSSTDYTYTKITDTNNYSLKFTVTGKTEIYSSTTEYCWLTYECDPFEKDSDIIKKGNTLAGYLDNPTSDTMYTFCGWYHNNNLFDKCYPTDKIYETLLFMPIYLLEILTVH